MRTEYECPVDGCGKVYGTADGLRGHMAGTMQYDEDHHWRHHDISHGDLSAAKREVPGVTDYGEMDG